MANVTSPNLIELGQIQKEQSNVSQRDDYFYEKEQLNERIKRLEEELERIKQDRNAIAKNTREPLLLKLDHAAERIKRLEEAGHELLYDNDNMENINRWHKAKEAKP